MKYALLTLIMLGSVGVAVSGERPSLTIHVISSHIYFGDGKIGHTASVRVSMPDGSQAELWCDSNQSSGNAVAALLGSGSSSVQRTCLDLEAGDYKAEVKKDIVWIYVELPAENPHYAPDGTLLPRKMRLEKVKYHVTTAHQQER